MFYFYLFLFCFFTSTESVVGSGGNIFGQTHFTPLEEFCAGTPVRITLNRSLPSDLIQSEKIYVSIVGWYGQSRNDQKLANVFLPQEDVILTTAGGGDYFLPGPLPYVGMQPTNKFVRDLDASIFNIDDQSFLSETSILPSVINKYLGIYGYYVFMFNDNNAPKLFFQFAMPIVSRVHVWKGREVIYKKGFDYTVSPVKSLLDGLSRPELNYQKWNFDQSGMKKTEIAHFELNMSYNVILKERMGIETYVGILIPGNLRDNQQEKYLVENQYVFYPQNMASVHYGLQWGTTINVFLYQNELRSIKFIFGNNLLYFLPADQIRTFDLVGKSWSRYLPVYLNFNTAYASESVLSNELTLVSRVSPNFCTIITSELEYIKDNAMIGIGYCMYGRQSESVTILEDLGNIFLKGTNSEIVHPVSIVRTVALRLMNEDVQIVEKNVSTDQLEHNNNYYYAKINNNIVDIQSATHPAILAGEIYLKGSLQLQDSFSILGGIGSRLCHNNAIIEYGLAWLGFEFLF